MRKRSGILSGFGQAIDATLKEHSLAEPLRPHTARAIWSEEVGADIAEATFAEAVRGGVLFVRVRSTVWANELTFYKSDIIARLNRRLGGKVIDDIHFKTSGRARPDEPLTAADAGGVIDDDALRSVQPTGPLAEIARRASRIDDSDGDNRLRTTTSRVARAHAWKKLNGYTECRQCSALFEPLPGQAAGDGVCPFCRAMSRSRSTFGQQGQD